MNESDPRIAIIEEHGYPEPEPVDVDEGLLNDQLDRDADAKENRQQGCDNETN